VRLTIAFGNQAYREKDFHELHLWFPETRPPCTVVFTQCGYTGETTDLCEGPSKKPIQSILLRDTDEQVYVCLGNKKIKIKRSVECILEDNWDLLRLEGAIEVESFGNNQCDGWRHSIKEKKQCDAAISIKEYLLAFCMWFWLIYVIVS